MTSRETIVYGLLLLAAIVIVASVAWRFLAPSRRRRRNHRREEDVYYDDLRKGPRAGLRQGEGGARHEHPQDVDPPRS